MRVFVGDGRAARALPGSLSVTGTLTLLIKTAVICSVLVSAAVIPSGQAFAVRNGERYPEGCTTIAVGKLASTDGSVITSHTCDGHDGRTWISIVPRKKHPRGSRTVLYNNTDFMHQPGDTTGLVYSGSIPQVQETYGYIYGIYPLMNEHQLAIGESTFEGKEIMKSDRGLFNCYELTRIMAERCRTAREAVKLAGELLEKYGYNDWGECLTIADTKEVWVMEIVGPGEGRVGAVWVARRVPDDEVYVNANASRIRTIDLKDRDNFMASKNVFSRAKELGLWNPKSGKPFEFCYVYADRKSMWARRREWRVFDVLAPSLDLDPNGENFPFSVKPEHKVSLEDIMKLFADTYEGTEFDMTKFMIIEDKDGKAVKSPYANPFMNYDQMPLWKINGSLGKLGERTIARYYCIYSFVSQSRDWLPDPIGGVVWFAWDNPAMSCHVPIYCCTKDLPESFKYGDDEDGRPPYTRKSAWWAVNRASTIAAHRWGDMRRDVYGVRDPILRELFENQRGVEDEALRLFREDPSRAVRYLSDYSFKLCERVTEAYWKLGDDLWTEYDERF